MAHKTELCALAATANLIGDTYVLLLLRDLSAGPSRFMALERTAGINSRTLTERLRRLEHDGLVLRTMYPEIPPRVEYTLTEKGAALLPILDAMRAYGERWLIGAGDAAPSVLGERGSGPGAGCSEQSGVGAAEVCPSRTGLQHRCSAELAGDTPPPASPATRP